MEPLLRRPLTLSRSAKAAARLYQRRGTASAAASSIYHEVPTHDIPPPPSPGPYPPPSSQKPAPQPRFPSAAPFSSFLTDTFARQHDYLRISVTERCNLRCTYCMPAEGVPLSQPSHLLTSPEIVYLSHLFVSEGVQKIRLTGGEPTVRKDIVELMTQIGELKEKGLKELAITTNGIALKRKLDQMAEAGLTGVNLSLDTLNPHMFGIMTRRKGFEAVMGTVERILEMKTRGWKGKLKINCVVMRGVNDREVLGFVELGREKDVEVRFIEYMPFEGNRWERGKVVPWKEMLGSIRERYPGARKVETAKSETSKTYEIPGFVGRFGFISSMTDDFCGSCNRLRITSDGNLKVCLFGNKEVSLRDILRKGNEGEPIDEEAMDALKRVEMDRRQSLPGSTGCLGYGQTERELLELIGVAVKRKKEKHAGMGQLENMKNRPMILIVRPDNKLSNLSSKYTWNPGNSKPHLVGLSHPPLSWLPAQQPLIPYLQTRAFHIRKFTKEPRSKPKAQPLAPSSNPSPNLPHPSPTSEVRIRKLAHELKYKSKPQAPPSNPPSDLPHLTPTSEVHMIPVSTKATTHRVALAIGHVRFSSRLTLYMIQYHALEKGDVLAVARIAGIQAVKKTAELIPLAHSGVPVEGVSVRVEAVGSVDTPVVAGDSVKSVDGERQVEEARVEKAMRLRHPIPQHGGVRIAVEVETTAKTGVEMEALAGVMGAALTVVDMVKSVDREVNVGGVRVVGKKGGRSGGWGVWADLAKERSVV